MRYRRHKSLALVLALAMIFPAGCGSSSQDYSHYVTLGEYKGLPVTMTVSAVDDEELEDYEKEQLSGYEEYTDVDTPIEDGSYVTVSLLAKEGSDVIYDFTDDEGYEMIIGDAEYGSEVDDALIGKTVGDELALDVSYDEEFEDGALCGRDISYEITVLLVQTVTYPELTDAFVQENFGEDTKSDWENTLRQELTASHEADATDEMRENLANQAVANATINGYPKDLYKEKQTEVESGYQSYADMFGCTLDEIYDMFGLDEAGLKEEYLAATNREMVFSLIREQEGLSLSDGEYQEKLEEYATDNDYDSVEELLADYDEDSLKSYFLEELTLDFLEDEADITMVTE